MLKAVIIKIEDKINSALDKSGIHKWSVFGTYFIISYVMSLRGSEGLMLELGSLKKCWKTDRKSHFIISLYGKLKGEDTLVLMSQSLELM